VKKLLYLFPALAICWACSNNPSIQTVESNGVQIAYNRYGTGDTTLLFVHGWCISKEYWQSQVDFFSPKYTVVTIDLPGFGQSGKINSSWSFKDYTENVKAVIGQLGLKNVIVIGHSMSGDILLELSNRYPQLLTGIVGIDNLHEPAVPLSEQSRADAEAFFSVFASRFDSLVTASMEQYLFQPFTDTAIKQRVMRSIINADSLVAVQVLKSFTFFAADGQSRMQKLNHKLYLVNSDVMPVKIDSLNKYCAKGAAVAYVHNTGHYPMIEKPGEFNRALQEVIHRLGQ
jgi:pimeloyl-ACP methyl ester carboxylesterase